MRITYKSLLIGCIVSVLAFTSCNDSFMDRFPETDITDKVFFSNPKDLETYTNGLYGNIITPSYSDVVSDNINSTENPDMYKLMRGEITPKTAGQWSWTRLRDINFVIEHAPKATGDRDEINHFIGVARLFRAYHYYGKVKTYSDVPWYSRTLKTTDDDLLYKTQDSRVLVVDSIMADLDFAVKHIKDYDSKTRLTKWSALALQSRIALNEGTYRNYHDELGLKDGNKFIQLARDAAKSVIESGKFSIYTTKTTLEAYQSLFVSHDLSRNSEIIMYDAYDKSMGRFNNSQVMYNYYYGLSRDLMEDYLALKDGKAVTFQQIAGYDKKKVNEVFENRDPRFGYTFMQPGHVRAGEPRPTIAKLGLGGYIQVKFDPLSYDQLGWNNSYTDLPIIRLGEVCLIYAEARAELGELTQSDLDLTINKLRDRVSMPKMNLSEIMANIDPVQTQRYPNVTGAQAGAIFEIRRERRIELACEGFRKDDLFRWKAGQRIAKEYEGIYIDKLGYQDLTGDGEPDVAIVATKADADNIPQSDKDKYKLVIYVLEGNTFYLSEGNSGFIKLTAFRDKFKFEEPKHYYWPLDEKDIQVNTNLVQNSFWK